MRYDHDAHTCKLSALPVYCSYNKDKLQKLFVILESNLILNPAMRFIFQIALVLSCIHEFSCFKLPVIKRVKNTLSSPSFAATLEEAVNAPKFDYSRPPPFTLNDIKSAIPKHLFVKKPLKSFGYLIKDVTLVAAFASLVMKFGNAFTWPLYWIAQGTMFWVNE